MKVNGIHLRLAIKRTTELIEQERDVLNDINVFPVADGDTGTNLYVTLKGTWSGISGVVDRRANVVADAIARASLRAAKGNSGVILSQFFWGFKEGVDGKAELGARDLAIALFTGSEYAYKAVANPIEGTMLTVMRETAEWALRFTRHIADVKRLLLGALKRGLEVLEKTPDLLAKIGKPKVIDSGAYGYTILLEGFLRALGESIRHYRPLVKKVKREKGGGELYCSNFLVEGADVEEVKALALSLGDSVVVLNGGGMVKVHLHTPRPDIAERELGRLGRVVDRRVEKIW